MGLLERRLREVEPALLVDGGHVDDLAVPGHRLDRESWSGLAGLETDEVEAGSSLVA
jgi:hypothetical protein